MHVQHESVSVSVCLSVCLSVSLSLSLYIYIYIYLSFAGPMAPDEFLCPRLTRRRVLRLVVAASAVMGAVVVLWVMRAGAVVPTTSQRADCLRGDSLVTPYRHLPKEEVWPEVEMDQHAPAGVSTKSAAVWN